LPNLGLLVNKRGGDFGGCRAGNLLFQSAFNCSAIVWVI
jgi:hypothetical protein